MSAAAMVLDPWLRSPVAYVAAIVLGALLGSFANVVILRVPRKESIVHPGSRCFDCGAAVRWYDNFPIVSWLVLRGRCRNCGVSFSARYMLVEAATALLVGAIWHLTVNVEHTDDEPQIRLMRFGIYTLFLLALVVITFIDLDHKKIPDKITYPGIPVFFVFGLLLRDVGWLDQAIGAVAGYAVVRLISDGYYWITGREGLGYGDGKLLALIGALLGWRAVLFALFGGSLLGTLVALPLLVITRRREAQVSPEQPLRHLEIAFGPFLCAGAVVYLFLQDALRVTFAL